MKQMIEGCVVVGGVQQQLAKGPPGSDEGDDVIAFVSSSTSTGCEMTGTVAPSRHNENGKGVGTTGLQQEIAVDTNGTYRVRRPFKKVLRSLPCVDQGKSVFSYKEVRSLKVLKENIFLKIRVFVK